MRDLRLPTTLVAMAILLSACAAEPPASLTRVSHPATLDRTTWRLLSVQGRPVPAGPDLTLEFEAERFSGNGGCNTFGGQFTYEPATGAVAVTGLFSTMRACLDTARNDVETAYLHALQVAAVANMDSDGHLVLSGPASVLVFEVGPRPAAAPVDASPSRSTAP